MWLCCKNITRKGENGNVYVYNFPILVATFNHMIVHTQCSGNNSFVYTFQTSISDLERLMYDPLKDIDLSEFKRSCSRICISYAERLGKGLSDMLSECQDNESMIALLCETVGLENVEPLISLLELPSINQHDHQGKIARCITSLKRHQDVSPCTNSVECTGEVVHIIVRPYKGSNFLVDNSSQ